MKSKIKNLKDKFTQRRGLEATVATVITVMFIVAVVLVNMIVSVIGDKVSLNIDVTSTQAYSLSDETVDYISNLDKDVTIDILNTKENFCAGTSEISGSSEFFTQASTLIDEYALDSNNITVNYVDTVQNPNFVDQYPDEKLYYDDVIVNCNGKYKVINVYNLFEMQSSSSGSSYSKSYSILSSNAEQVITSAILNLASDEVTKVTFLTGYEEDDYSALQELLTENNYDVETTDVLTGTIDPDTKLLFVYGPKNDYDQLGIARLTEFMNNTSNDGVSIIYAANPEAGDLTNLNSFLQNYGVSVGSGAVYSTEVKKYIPMYNNGQYYYSEFYAKNDYSDSEFTDAIANSNVPVIVPESKPVEILDESLTSPILTMGKGGISTSLDSEIDENAEAISDIPVAAMSKTNPQGNTDITNNVVVIGSDIALDQYQLASTSVNNSSYFLNMFNTLSNREESVVIPSKSLNTEALGTTMIQAYVMAAIFMVILPLAILIYGICVWASRRHR